MDDDRFAESLGSHLRGMAGFKSEAAAEVVHAIGTAILHAVRGRKPALRPQSFPSSFIDQSVSIDAPPYPGQQRPPVFTD